MEKNKFILNPDQREVINDFLLTCGKIERDFNQLVHRPNGGDETINLMPDLLSQLIKNLETIKENFVFCQIFEASRFINHIIQTFDSVKEKRFALSEDIIEALLHCFDHLVAYVGRLSRSETNEIVRADVLLLDPFLRRLSCAASQDQSTEITHSIFTAIAESYEIYGDSAEPPIQAFLKCVEPWSGLGDVEVQNFKQLIAAQEKRNPYWKNRIHIQINVAIEVNRVLEKPCDETQLLIGICLHDLGMVFLPDSILLKNTRLDADEQSQVQQHVTDSSVFLSLSTRYQEAREMVLHHHEHYDGAGYPLGLIGNEICVGGQLIALADAYYSMTNQRPDRDFHRSLLRTLVEVNQVSGSQFSPEIVKAFNHVMRQKIGFDAQGDQLKNDKEI